MPAARFQAPGQGLAVRRGTAQSRNQPRPGHRAHRRALELSAGDLGVYASNVFHTVRQLEQAGVVRRIESSKDYVLRQPGEVVDLLCGRCGNHHEHIAPGLHGLVEQLANASGFKGRHLVAEVAGTCRLCLDGPPSEPRATGQLA